MTKSPWCLLCRIFLYNVVIGVVKELKGYNQNKKIEILIEGHEDNKKV